MALTEQEFEARLSKLSSILEDKINTPIRTAKEMLGKIPFQFVVKNALFIFDETKSLKCLEHGRVLSECPLADRKAKAAFVLDFVDEVLTAYGV
jgi:hypothetical protein